MKTIAFILFIISQLADFYTTYRALNIPDVREGNPLLRILMGKIGIVPALSVFKGFVIIFIGIILWYVDTLAVQIAVIVVSLGYGYAVYNNYKVWKGV